MTTDGANQTLGQVRLWGWGRRALGLGVTRIALSPGLIVVRWATCTLYLAPCTLHHAPCTLHSPQDDLPPLPPPTRAPKLGDIRSEKGIESPLEIFPSTGPVEDTW